MRRFPLNELAVDRHKLQIFGFVASSLPIISSYLWYLAWLVLAIASRVKSSWLEPVDTDALWELRKSHNDHQIPRRPWCIVTGGASGVGREACIMLAHRGLQVVIADKNVEEAHRTAECINEIFSSDTAEAHELDLANVDSIKAFVRRITVSEQCSMAAARYNADR